MAERSNILRMIMLSLLYCAVAQDLSPKKAVTLAKFDCQLNVNNVKWIMECESQNVETKPISKFFVAKLRGIFDPDSPVVFDKLLLSISFKESELYLCDVHWKYVIKSNQHDFNKHCTKCNKFLRTLAKVLNETLLNSLEISNTSKTEFMLNILRESSHLSQIILSDNSLSNISLPICPNNSITSIKLERNQIKNISENSFNNLPSLILLDLSHNLLKYVSKSMFDKITSILELDLSYNIIESISNDSFSNLASLKAIFISNNNLKYISENVFKFNSLLSDVDISNNEFKKLPSTLFHNLLNLRNISCSNCSLFELDRNLFTNSPNILKMNFSCNNLISIDEDIFKDLSLLQILDLGTNEISCLSKNHFQNKQYLLELYLIQNEIEFMENGLFAGAPNIRILDMSKNKIKILTDEHVKKFIDLEYLSLSHNSMVSVELGLTRNSVYIRNLDISNNAITEFNIGWKRLTYMEKFIADNNQLTSLDLPPCIPTVKQTITFTFKYNNISGINTDALNLDENRMKADMLFQGSCLFLGREKIFVDLTHNPLFCDCHLYPFYKYVKDKAPRKLEAFLNEGNLICAGPQYVSNQSLIFLPDDVLSCPVTQECPESCFCGVRGKDNLTFVNCTSRNFTQVPQIIPHKAAALYFNDNHLESMMSLNTKDWRNLSELYLDRNFLETLDGWNIPASLRHLSVRGNKLKSLPSSLMQFISNLSSFQLFFGHNDEHCDCDRKKLKKFLLENMRFIGDNEDILCAITGNDTSTLLPLTSLPNNDLCPMLSNPLNYYQKKLVISLCMLFVFVIFLLVVYYKQRQLILSFLYIHCDDLFHLCFSEEDYDESHIFDAFVAYSSSDQDIVMKLMEELETKSPFFKLCIHERNWLPGNFITENIINSVESSKRTIVILSNTFISSPWFNLELRAAVSNMSKDKMCKIIFILAEKSVSLDNIDCEIKHVISKRTYLVWGERWFWEKLRYAMPRKKYAKIINANNLSKRSISETSLVHEAA